MGDMTIAPFLSSHPQRLFDTVALTQRHRQHTYIFNASTSSTHPHLQPINIFNASTSSTVHIFSLSTSSTHQHLQRINIFNVSTSSTYSHLPRTARHARYYPPNPPILPICIQHRLFHINTSSMDAMQCTLTIPPHPTHLYTTSSYMSRLKVPGNSGG